MKTIEELLQQEEQAKATLREAEENYKAASQEIRNQLGSLFAAERERAGLSCDQLAIMLGTNRMKVFASENPGKVPNPFSVDTLIEMIEVAKKVADMCQDNQFKPVRRGRPTKFKK